MRLARAAMAAAEPRGYPRGVRSGVLPVFYWWRSSAGRIQFMKGERVLPELEALLQLQRYDARLMEMQRKRDEIPRRRAALKAALDQAKAAQDHAKKDLEKVRLERRAQEKEIEVLPSEGVEVERPAPGGENDKEKQGEP